MSDLQEKIGNSLAKIQSGIETGKKKLETSKEIFRLQQQLREAGAAKGKLYVKMGRQAYYLFRQGNMDDDCLRNLAEEMVELDKGLWQLSAEIAQLTAAFAGRTCAKCGQMISGAGRFCEHCGNNVEECPREDAGQPCSRCNAVVPAQALFCPCCGLPLGGSSHVL